MFIYQEARKIKDSRVLYQIPKEEKRQLYQTFMHKYFTPEEFEAYSRELVESNFYKEFIDAKSQNWHDRGPVAFNGLQTLYALIRKLKPNVFVETGIRFGGSSAAILFGLHKNQQGKLISIDKWTEQPEKIGCFVPEWLKDKWEPIKGKTCDVLPSVETNGGLDLFLHDSEHSYKNMYFEYDWSKDNLKDDGLIISHDIGANNSFFDFSHNFGLPYYLVESDMAGRYCFGVIENTKGKPEMGNLHRPEPKREIKPIRKGLYSPIHSRDNFEAGRKFVDSIRNEFEIKKETLKWIKGTNDEYLIFKNGKKVARVAPRNRSLYGGYVRGKPFRILNEKDEKELLEEIRK